MASTKGNNAGEIAEKAGNEEEKSGWKLQNKSNFQKQKSLSHPFRPPRHPADPQNLFHASWDWVKYVEQKHDS